MNGAHHCFFSDWVEGCNLLWFWKITLSPGSNGGFSLELPSALDKYSHILVLSLISSGGYFGLVICGLLNALVGWEYLTFSIFHVPLDGCPSMLVSNL